MASISSRFGSMGRNALDLPVAALAGLAVAFVAYAVPGDLLAELVVASGLPAIIPAAEPPLGGTARAGFGFGAALAAFGLVFGLLRLLDRTSDSETEGEPAAPRVRRRDFHPDAPAPRPIAALRDLGEPDAEEAVPLWLSPADAVGAEADEGEVHEVHELELTTEVEAEAETEAKGPNVPGYHDVARIVTEPEEPAPQPGPDPEPGTSSGSIGELMARLERGLAARRAAADAPIFAAPAAPEPAPSEPGQDYAHAPEPADDRLQSAIASLQRLAAAQH